MLLGIMLVVWIITVAVVPRGDRAQAFCIALLGIGALVMFEGIS